MNKLLMKTIPAAAIRKGIVPFSVYATGEDGHLHQLCEAGNTLDIERDELVSRHGWQLQIAGTDEAAWLAYAGAAVESLIHSHLIRFDDKAEVVLSLVSRAFAHLWNNPGNLAAVTACSSATHSLVDLILHSKEHTAAFFMSFADERYILARAVNVSSLSILIGELLFGKDRDVLWKIGLAGMLRDIGIATLDPGVINRPQNLTPEEWGTMKQHPLESLRIVQRAGLPSSTLAAMRQHHERADGSGYPDGVFLSGIHPYARIVAVADVYDAITSDRSYRNGRTHVDALREMDDQTGHYDPVSFDALLLIVLNNDRLVDEFKRGQIGSSPGAPNAPLNE
jgi:HD-GYP domain-containing protein (c-di-GMP phosphodiesterase class II)